MMLVILILIAAAPEQAAAAASIRLTLDGRTVPADPVRGEPDLRSNRVYVPLRLIGEILGGQVQWQQTTRQILIASPGEAIIPVAPDSQGRLQISINGAILASSAAFGQAYITGQGRTMVPLRMIGEAIGCSVTWDNTTRTVVLKRGSAASEPSRGAAERPTAEPTVDTQTGTAIPLNQIPPETVTPVQPEPAAPTVLDELAARATNLKLWDGRVINSAELSGMRLDQYTPEQITLLEGFNRDLAPYPDTITLWDGSVLRMRDLTITGPPIATADQLRAWIAAQTPRVQAKMKTSGKPFNPIPDLADLYIEIGRMYNIRGDIAFCQAAKETFYWQFTGLVQPYQNNYCGLAATGAPAAGSESLRGADPARVAFQPGVHGAVFTMQADGVEAHIQHLYAYACDDALPVGRVMVDPRFVLVKRGIAPTWIGLNARWAIPGTTYGHSILFDYWRSVVTP